jgi:hypothetical protein
MKYLSIFLFVTLFFNSCSTWDSCYNQSYYEIKFIDKNGQPLENVQLEVFHSRYNNTKANNWPISNYQTVTLSSDSSGILRMYHITKRGIEFGGYRICGRGFSKPTEFCKFRYYGKVIYKIKFLDLYNEFMMSTDSTAYDSKKTVSIQYKWPNDSISEENCLPYYKTIQVLSIPK